jgi:hypothetical protein
MNCAIRRRASRYLPCERQGAQNMLGRSSAALVWTCTRTRPTRTWTPLRCPESGQPSGKCEQYVGSNPVRP